MNEFMNHEFFPPKTRDVAVKDNEREKIINHWKEGKQKKECKDLIHNRSGDRGRREGRKN